MTETPQSVGELSLQLKANRDTYVQSESIKIHVTLTNKDSNSIEIEDLTVLNDPLHFYAINKSGRRFSATLLAQQGREGEDIIAPIYSDLKVLEPQETRVIDVDLLRVLGELPEDYYKIKAVYQSKGILTVQSNILRIQILRYAPVYSSTFQDYLRTDGPIRTAWIDEEKDGTYLFLMESSSNNPQILRSNLRITKLEKPYRVLPTVLESYGQDFEDVIWKEDNIIQRTVTYKGLFKHKKQIKVPISDFQLLKPSLTDAHGNLYFVTVSREDDSSRLCVVSCTLEGVVETSEICRLDMPMEKYTMVFDTDLTIHIACASNSGDIYYIHSDPRDPSKIKNEAGLLVSGKFPVVDLQFFLAFFDEEQNHQVILHYLTEEAEDKLCSHVLNVGTKKPVRYLWIIIPDRKRMKLLQVALDKECLPYFLFQDDFGALLYKSHEGAERIKVTETGEAYPSNVDCPVLLVSSNLTRHYGIYLRYIKSKESFVYKKLESLR